MGVTRIFEKIEEGVKNQQAEISGVKKIILNWAQRQALHHHTQEMSGQSHSSLGYRLAQKTVFKKVNSFPCYAFIYILSIQTDSSSTWIWRGCRQWFCYRGLCCVPGDSEVPAQPRHEAAGGDLHDGDGRPTAAYEYNKPGRIQSGKSWSWIPGSLRC